MDVLSPQNNQIEQVNSQFEMLTNTPEMQEFGFTAEMSELAWQQAALYQDIESFDLLGALAFDENDPDSIAQHEQIFNTIVETNLTYETLTLEGLENAVYVQRAAFAAERAAEQRLFAGEDEEDDGDTEE